MSMMGAGASWRHLRSDRSVVDQRLKSETLRRVARFARPHRRLISVFLALTVVDASLVVVNPLLVQRIVDDGILKDDGRLVTLLALAMAATALFTALLAVIAGYLSSRIGEGLIFDLRTQVFARVQRQSLAFFTRTQTGALVSRLNNDVIGAQRAFTSALSSTVSNAIAVVVVGITMFALSWQVTLLCLGLFPILLVTSRFVSNRLAGLTRAADGRQRRHGQRDDRALQRRRRDAAQALRAPPRGGRAVRRQGGRGPRPRGPHLPRDAHLRRRHDAGAGARDRAGLRRSVVSSRSTAPSPSAPCSRSRPCCCG